MSSQQIKITVKTDIKIPVEKVWKYWVTPEDIVNWNSASASWHTPYAENDLHIGGSFNYRMEAKDGSSGFDFGGIYTDIVLYKQIKYTLNDDRKVNIIFLSEKGMTKIIETFDAENKNPPEIQRNGWQSILDNFKRYAEAKNK